MPFNGRPIVDVDRIRDIFIDKKFKRPAMDDRKRIFTVGSHHRENSKVKIMVAVTERAGKLRAFQKIDIGLDAGIRIIKYTQTIAQLIRCARQSRDPDAADITLSHVFDSRLGVGQRVNDLSSARQELFALKSQGYIVAGSL